jgi:hypothetical protein
MAGVRGAVDQMQFSNRKEGKRSGSFIQELERTADIGLIVSVPYHDTWEDQQIVK